MMSIHFIIDSTVQLPYNIILIRSSVKLTFGMNVNPRNVHTSTKTIVVHAIANLLTPSAATKVIIIARARLKHEA